MPSDSLVSFLDQTRKLKNLTKTEERELARRRDLGDESAKHTLVEHNVRLAVKYAREWRGCGLPLEDLVQEACVGLSIAAERFDPDRGRFTTYATRWIRKCLWEAGYAAGTIKRPSKLSRTVVRVYEFMAEHPGAAIEDIADGIGKSASEVREAMDHGRVVASINDDGFTEVRPEELDEIVSVLDVLDVEEREAVSWRYGIYGEALPVDLVAERMTQDKTLPGEYTHQDAGRLCRAAVRKLRAARYDDDVDDVPICIVEES